MNIRYTCILGLLAVCILALSSISITAQNSKTRSDLSRSFTKFDLVRVDAARDQGSVRSIKVRAAGKDHQLTVWQNDMFAADYRAEDTAAAGTREIERPAVNTYKGHVTGEDRSEVRLTIDEFGTEGFFDAGGERYFVEPARRYSESAAADQSVVYLERDSLNTSTFFCAADMPAKIVFGESLLDQNSAQAILASRNLEVATEADLQYVTILGGPTQANANITSILNMVEGTYVSELDLEITITFQHTWSVADPFAGATSGDVLLNFLDYWGTNFPHSSYPRDTAHLFSGKSNLLSAGIAFVGAVCYTPEYAYGVSGYVSWAPGKFLIPAHEIGHNLGAEHAEAAQGCANTIMNAFLTGSAVLSFCPYSRNEIGAFMTQNGGCLGGTSPTPTPTPTPTPVPTPTPTPFPTPTPTPTPVPTPTPTPVPTPTPNQNLRTRFDFDGDRKADLVVFRPSNGTWYMNLTTSGFYQQGFGQNGDQAVSADYDGDGKTDPAVYRSGTWYRVRSSTGTYDTAIFGIPGDIPAPGDFDGDNMADVAVFRPSTGQWFWIGSSNGNFSITSFGVGGDVPMTADYDGDGRADIAVFRPSNGTWYRLNSSSGFSVQQFGAPGDKAVSGDFDGDGRADLAVWRPSNGNWYVLGGSSYSVTTFGVPGDIPTSADYDGDGIADISVFRPSNGTWYRLNSGNKAFVLIQYGQNGDVPAPASPGQ